MAKRTRTQFLVKGADPFPVDMLRYDCCWPMQETDSYAIMSSVERSPSYRTEPRVIELVTEKEGQITIGRWQSFGWTVFYEKE
jgi:hypothetical protein